MIRTSGRRNSCRTRLSEKVCYSQKAHYGITTGCCLKEITEWLLPAMWHGVAVTACQCRLAMNMRTRMFIFHPGYSTKGRKKLHCHLLLGKSWERRFVKSSLRETTVGICTASMLMRNYRRWAISVAALIRKRRETWRKWRRLSPIPGIYSNISFFLNQTCRTKNTAKQWTSCV